MVDERWSRAQRIAEELAKRVNKGEKANLWVCNPLPPFYDESDIPPQCKVGKCRKCKGPILYDPALKHNLKKWATKICKLCTIKHHSNNINKEMLAYLTGGLV